MKVSRFGSFTPGSMRVSRSVVNCTSVTLASAAAGWSRRAGTMGSTGVSGGTPRQFQVLSNSAEALSGRPAALRLGNATPRLRRRLQGRQRQHQRDKTQHSGRAHDVGPRTASGG